VVQYDAQTITQTKVNYENSVLHVKHNLYRWVF